MTYVKMNKLEEQLDKIISIQKEVITNENKILDIYNEAKELLIKLNNNPINKMFDEIDNVLSKLE
jgi:hypothetical protein